MLSLLTAAVLLVHFHGVSGQGLRLDSTAMGASSRIMALDSTYKTSADLAVSLRAAWNPSARSSCATATGSLCGTGFSGKALAQEALLLAASPASYDSRSPANTGGFNPISTPGDQGECNACVAFAVTAAAEAAIASVFRVSVPSERVPRLSPRDLFFCGAGGERTDCTNGWNFRDGLSQLAGHSVLASWQCMPFDNIGKLQSNAGDVCKGSCTIPASPAGSFSWTRLQRFDSIARIQQHIRMHGGVVTRLNLYKGFRQWFESGGNKGGIYSEAPSDSNYDQGHAVFVIGYNNPERYWLVKNSWGTGWADGGFAKIRFGLLGMMDPEFTYGVTFTPYDTWAVPGAPRLASQGGGCYSYTARGGDYASKIATHFGVAIEEFLAVNAQALNTMDAFIPSGKTLKVCNPTQNAAAGPPPGPNLGAAQTPAAAPGGKAPCAFMGDCGGGAAPAPAPAAKAAYDPNSAYMG